MDRLKDMAGGFNPADIQKYTKGISWPIGKDDLTTALKGNGAPDEMVDKVKGSNQNQFKGPEDVVSTTQG